MRWHTWVVLSQSELSIRGDIQQVHEVIHRVRHVPWLNHQDIPRGVATRDIAMITISMVYRAKRPTRHSRVSDKICIVTHTSQVKTNAHGSHFELSSYYRTCFYFYVHVYKVAMQKKAWSMVATIMTKALATNGVFLISVKAQKLWRKFGLFSAA